MFRHPRLRIALLPVLLTAFAHASTADDRAPTSATALFEQQVRSILHDHCYECHSGAEVEGELTLDSSAGLRKGGSRGALIDAEHPDKSLLLSAVRYGDPDLAMPPDGKLSDELVAVLEKWVRLGGDVPEFGETASGRSAEIDWKAAREFWSFQPVGLHEQPHVRNSEWPRQRIDHFVLARLETNGRSPSTEASRQTLIRRLSFDLIGLPPAPDEVESFTADDAPDAVERLVDRLLASPHYGERWGRCWLDVARYADETAAWLEAAENAWLYRDWVVAALNDDLAYDDFVRLQLAADLMPDVPPSDHAALGFLGLSPTYWKELRLAPNVIQTVVMEEWEERIDAVSRSFLGLTVACARCHDHKFDPITMEDYYALAGVFASTQLAERPLLSTEQEERVRAARGRVDALEAELKKLKDQQSDEAQELRRQIEAIVAETPNYDSPWAHVVYDAAIYVEPDGTDKTKIDYRKGEARDLPVYRRGSPASPGEIVPRRFLRVLSGTDSANFDEGSGRLELAESILNEGRPLAARVIVNRVWRHHFGEGLVRTASNFGAQGERPSHPELLDDLSDRFIEHGWSLKWLHREILLSATYRQSSEFNSVAAQADPENRLLWRMNRRRLDAEAWRDAMLAAAGAWDDQIGGRPLPLDDPEHHRRTIYGRVGRREMNDMLRLFDVPVPSSHSEGRTPTTTPLQQLYVLNSPFVERQAELLAERLTGNSLSDRDRIELCYQLLFGRGATDAEQELAERFLASDGSQQSGKNWQDYVHALLGLNEFAFVD